MTNISCDKQTNNAE